MLKNNKLIQETTFLIIIFSIVFIFFLPLFFPKLQLIMTPDFGRSDSWHMSISTKYFLWQKLEQNELPLWSAKLGTGYPLQAEGQIGTFFLPNLILYKLFPFVIAYNLSLVLAFITFACGMYIWLRILKFTAFASIFGSLTLTFSGTLMVHLTHITLLQGLSLLPWVLVGTHLLAHKTKVITIVLFSLVCAIQFLAGFPQASFITLLLSGAYYVYLVQGKNHKLLSYGVYLVSIALFLGLIAYQFLLSEEFLKYTLGSGGFNFGTAAYFSFPYKHLLTFLYPYLLGNPKYGTYPSFSLFDGSVFWENTGYFGILPLLLLLLLFIKSFRKRLQQPVLFWLFILVSSFLLMLGSHSPLYFIYTYWPFNLFRVPSRFIWTFVFALMMICVYVFDLVWQRANRLIKILLVILILFNTLHLAFTWHDYHVWSEAKMWFDVPPLTNSFGPNDRILTVGSDVIHNQYFNTQGWQDMKPFFFLNNSLFPNSNLIWGIYQHDVSAGRDLFRPAVIDELVKKNIYLNNNQEASISAEGRTVLNMESINDIVSTGSYSGNLRELAREKYGSQTIYLYKNDTALSRVYITTNIIKIDTVTDMTDYLNSGSIQNGDQVFLEKDINLKVLAHEKLAKLISDTDTQQIIHTSSDGDGILVLADTFYPGWQAAIDGKPTAIYPANIRQRAIFLPQGEHTVIFTYKPTTQKIGLLISGFSLFSCFCIILYYILRARSSAQGG